MALTFKDCVAADAFKTFLNQEEHAETRTVRYNGEVYENVPVIEDSMDEVSRSNSAIRRQDYAQGLLKREVTLFCAAESLGGVMPERGTYLEVSEGASATVFHKYRVVEASKEVGMYRLELEEMRG